jgi:DeoR/GlpR family transcriptional regulator of sugar metabolism
MSLSYEDRKRKIMEQLSRDEKVQVPVLAEELNVSTETIRRDLERLNKEGNLKKVYGGAV